MKLVDMRTKEENIRFINPQLFGCCPINYILKVQFDNFEVKHPMNKITWNAVYNGLIVHEAQINFLNNLDLCYGKEVVTKFIKEHKI